jgi:hypothetical protein
MFLALLRRLFNIAHNGTGLFTQALVQETTLNPYARTRGSHRGRAGPEAAEDRICLVSNVPKPSSAGVPGP